MSYQNTASLKPCNMLSGVPLFRPANRVFGNTAKQEAEWALAIAVRDVAGAESNYAASCRELGKANSYSRVARRADYRASAMRLINKSRARRRAALKALAVAQAAMLAFAPAEAV